MRALSAAQLLEVWERGATQPPVQQMLTLLAAACPDTPLATLAALSIGQRDTRLLTLREWAFGPRLTGLATCPPCGEHLEMAFAVTDIRVTTPGEEEPEQKSEALLCHAADYEVSFRLPNSVDLADLAATPDQPNVAVIQERILQRCLLTIRHHGEETFPAELPAFLVDALGESMAQADPQANVQLALSCPACGRQWHALFDIASFFWDEIHAWGLRLLREVHTLASAYGWCEADIVALSPWRRQTYLEMVNG